MLRKTDESNTAATEPERDRRLSRFSLSEPERDRRLCSPLALNTRGLLRGLVRGLLLGADPKLGRGVDVEGGPLPMALAGAFAAPSEGLRPGTKISVA